MNKLGILRTVNEILAHLNSIADPEKIAFKEKKYGIIAQNAVGIYMKDLKELVKVLPKDDQLALELFDSGIYEARLLCSKLFNPKNLTEELMEKWIVVFDNWEICDSFSMTVFARSRFAAQKIHEWADREPEFERRAAFATLAAYCMAEKKAENELFDSFLPLIKKAVTDERNFVKKAVNWALRNIGKRNIDLNKQAIQVAKDILKLESRSAKWIAKDALRELEKEGVRLSDYQRHIYRK